MGAPQGAWPSEQAWRTAARRSRAVVLCGIAAVTVLGALLGPLERTVVWAPGIGVATVGTALLVVPYAAAGWTRRRTVVWSAIAGVILVPFSTGLAALGRVGGWLLIVLLVLGALWLVQAALDAPAPPRDETAVPGTPTRPEVGDLPVETLVQEWRASAAGLRADAAPEVRAAAADLRSAILDELARRDPTGVDRWLSAGGDPADHLSADPGRKR